MNKIEHGDHRNEKIEAFESQQEIMRRIKEIGFAKYAETIQNLPDAFDLAKHKASEDCQCCLCCMDGRTSYGEHSAGSGILLSDEEFAKLVKGSGIDSISSHTGCGAAKIYAAKMGLDGNPDEIAKDWAKKAAEKFGLKYIHLEVDKPFHYERVCYYDGTGKFNYGGVNGLPAGFIVGRKFMTKKASLAEVSVAKNIIFGDHGFGEELLTEENPFLFVAIGETEQQTEELKKELQELVVSLGNKVKIDGFVEPNAEQEVKEAA